MKRDSSFSTAPAFTVPVLLATLLFIPVGAAAAQIRLQTSEPVQIVSPGAIAQPGPTALDLAKQLRAEGVPFNEALAKLMQQHMLEFFLAANALRQAGYPLNDLTLWLYWQGHAPAMVLRMTLSVLAYSGAPVSPQAYNATWLYDAGFATYWGALATQKAANQATIDIIREGRALNVQLLPLLEGLVAAKAPFTAAATGMFSPGGQILPRDHVIDLLWRAYKPTVQQMFSMLRQQNGTMVELFQTGAAHYNLMPAQSAAAMRNLQIPANQILAGARQLWTTMALPAAIGLLHGAGFDVRTTLDAARQSYNVTPRDLLAATHTGFQNFTQSMRQEVILYAFNNLGLSSGTVIGVLKSAGFTLGAVFNVMRHRLNRSAPQIASQVRQNGIAANELIGPLIQTYTPPAAEAGKFAAETLRAGGYTAEETAAALKAQFNQSAGWVASRLNEAGFTFSSIVDAISTVFAMTVSAVIQLLASLGIK